MRILVAKTTAAYAPPAVKIEQLKRGCAVIESAKHYN
jgi:hypothetical protein